MQRVDLIDVRKVLALLWGAYPRFYKDLGDKAATDIENLWLDIFRNDDPRIVNAATVSFIEGDEKGFPPSIGQIKAKMRLLTGGDELTEADAWRLVSKAISNGLYGAQEEFDKLPPIVRRVVGSPNMLREWAQMDTDTVHSVVASNFQRSFRTVSAREKELSKLPADVKAALGQLAAGLSLEGEGNRKQLGGRES